MFDFFGNIFDIINVPLGMILKGIYWVLGNYGWSIIVFALLSKLAMLPSAIKTHKNQIRMRKIQPKMKRLAEKYHNDSRNPKYQEELQELYQSEGYNPMSGCLPTLIQFPLIIGLWNVIRQPLTYMCNLAPKTLYDAVNHLITNAGSNPAVQRLVDELNKFSTDKLTIVADGKLAEYGDKVQKALETAEIFIADAINSNAQLDGLSQIVNPDSIIETEFLGINLGESASAQPQFWSWFLLVPVIAAGSSFLLSFISMRMNRSQSDHNDPTSKSMNMMMYTMPLLSLWIGYSMNFGVAIYWIANNVFSLIQTLLLPLFLKEKEEVKPEKEKKMNYTQLEKMKRDEENLNGEAVEKKNKNKKKK